MRWIVWTIFIVWIEIKIEPATILFDALLHLSADCLHLYLTLLNGHSTKAVN